MDRRVFLKSAAIALTGTALTPNVFVRMANAATTGGKKTLVAIFQRGAVDGLNVVVPLGDRAYAAARPSLAIRDALALDGFFGAHPSLQPLMPFWKDRSLAFIQAVGSPDATRSHFDAQDFMESGTPGVKSTRDGFLSRALATRTSASQVRGVAMSTAMPRILAGAPATIAAANLAQFGVRDTEFEALYDSGPLAETARQSFQAARVIGAITKQSSATQYPRGALGDSLKQIAQLIKGNVGLEVAFADVGGWDTHANQANALSNNLRSLSEAIAAFARDLGSRMGDVVLVTMSEFGRTVRENGNRGTDHGHATVMLALGGTIRGGKVHGSWPGLATDQLFERRDLAVTTDFRDVFAELLTRHLRVGEMGRVFPGHRVKSVGLL